MLLHSLLQQSPEERNGAKRTASWWMFDCMKDLRMVPGIVCEVLCLMSELAVRIEQTEMPLTAADVANSKYTVVNMQPTDPLFLDLAIFHATGIVFNMFIGSDHSTCRFYTPPTWTSLLTPTLELAFCILTTMDRVLSADHNALVTGSKRDIIIHGIIAIGGILSRNKTASTTLIARAPSYANFLVRLLSTHVQDEDMVSCILYSLCSFTGKATPMANGVVFDKHQVFFNAGLTKALASAIATHPVSPFIARYVTANIRNLLHHGLGLKQETMALGIYDRASRAVRAFPRHFHLLRCFCGLVANLAIEDDIEAQIVSKGGIEVLISCLQSKKFGFLVYPHIFMALRNLSTRPLESPGRFAERGALGTITAILLRQAPQPPPQLMEDGLAIFRNLSKHRRSDIVEQLLDNGALDVILRAFTDYTASSTVLHEAFFATYELIQAGRGDHQALYLGSRDIVPKIVAVLNQYPTNVDIGFYSGAAKLAASLAYHNDTVIQHHFRNFANIEPFVRMLENHQTTPGVHSGVASLFVNICQKCSEVLEKADVVAVALRSMQLFPRKSSVQDWCICLLHTLLRYTPSHSSSRFFAQMLQKDAPLYLLAAMETCRAEEVQQYSSLIFAYALSHFRVSHLSMTQAYFTPEILARLLCAVHRAALASPIQTQESLIGHDSTRAVLRILHGRMGTPRQIHTWYPKLEDLQRMDDLLRLAILHARVWNLADNFLDSLPPGLCRRFHGRTRAAQLAITTLL